MLARTHRLRRRKDFDRVYKSGKTLNTALFRIKTLPNKEEGPRFGVVVANKVIKSAVERNRKKRQIRSVLEELVLRVVGEYDIIVLGQSAIVDASFKDMKEDIEQGLHKIGFLK